MTMNQRRRMATLIYRHPVFTEAKTDSTDDDRYDNRDITTCDARQEEDISNTTTTMATTTTTTTIITATIWARRFLDVFFYSSDFSDRASVRFMLFRLHNSIPVSDFMAE